MPVESVEILLRLADFALQIQPEDNLTGNISRAWYNDPCTMVAKPIKCVELHHTMIQFLITKNSLTMVKQAPTRQPCKSVSFIILTVSELVIFTDTTWNSKVNYALTRLRVCIIKPTIKQEHNNVMLEIM